MTLRFVTAAGLFLKRQLVGFFRGLGLLFRRTTADDWLPRTITFVLWWFVDAVGFALGTADPFRQIAASVSLLIFAIIGSTFLLFPVVFVAVFSVTTLIGLARLFPIVDDYFVRLRAGVV